MNTAPDHDELRIRAKLLRTIDGAPATPGAPAGDWWERLYDEREDDHAGAAPKRRRIPAILRPAKPEPEPAEEAEDDPEWEDAEGDDETTPQAVKRSRRNPSRQLQQAYAGLDGRTRWLINTTAGAGLGWFLGLEPAMHGWIAGCAHDQGQTAGLILGLGMVAAGSYAAYRTRGWWPPLAWCCRIPLATAILALALYAPGVTP